jgi:hypothetical protein
MESDSLIRFACVTMPSVDRGGITFPYLKAIEGTGLGVRIMPIGMARFDTAPWSGVSHLFLTALKTRYINVVCVEPGVMLGAAVSAAQFSAPGNGDAAAYDPPTAISGLFTVGIPNVAILSGKGMPEAKELESLKHYTAVVCPTPEGANALTNLGINTFTVEPESDQLSRLFSGMTPA